MPTAAHARRQLAFPFLFVLLWSTGFIAAKYGLAYAPPLTFLLYRFVLVAALMGIVAVATRAVWPATLKEVGHVAVSAWLVHGIYLGGVLSAIAGGMSAGMAAMLVGLQPILTVLLARGWLGERVVSRQWLGLALGLAGVWLVVRHKVELTDDSAGLIALALALVGISVGTLYQKRYCSRVDLRCGAVIQFGAGALDAAVRVCARLGRRRAVGGRGQPSLLAPAPRCCVERGGTVLPRSGRDGRHGVAHVRREAGCGRRRGHGADQRGGCAGAPGKGSGDAMTIRVPAIRSCRNWRSGSTSAQR